jgi:hypothetical protein
LSEGCLFVPEKIKYQMGDPRYAAEELCFAAKTPLIAGLTATLAEMMTSEETPKNPVSGAGIG